jgi:hypothetical protein
VRGAFPEAVVRLSKTCDILAWEWRGKNAAVESPRAGRGSRLSRSGTAGQGKTMNRIIVHLVAMLALVCAGVASAQTTTETFESFSANATQFTSGGVTFDIATHNIVVFDIYDGSPNSYGWNGTANDKKFIDNTRSAADGGYWGVLPDFSIKTHDGSRFSVGSFWLYPAMFNLTSLGSGEP